MDTAGRLHVRHPVTGEVLGVFHPSRRYLCPPAVRGDRLIVCTFRSLRSYPMRVVLGEGGGEGILARARAALAHGRTQDALTVALEAIRHDLDRRHQAGLTAYLSR